MIVLDTNVLSELMKAAGSDAVRLWLDGIRRGHLFTTAVSRAEILYGLAVMDPGIRREAKTGAALMLFNHDFAGRVLPFDEIAADHFAAIVAGRRRSGKRIEFPDAQIAAIARAHGMSVATRNTADFVDCGVDLIDPWKA